VDLLHSKYGSQVSSPATDSRLDAFIVALDPHKETS
jgi:hypothetical protein